MPGAGLEPARPEGHPILSRARLTSSATPAARVTPTARRIPCRRMTQDTVIALSVLGVVGQVLVAPRARRRRCSRSSASADRSTVCATCSGATSCGERSSSRPIATGGSLFYSQVAHFVPCEFCWFQRVLMYPLSILTLLHRRCAATTGRARYLLAAADRRGRHVDLPHPDRARRDQASRRACSIWRPAAAASTGSNHEFGYLTIPTLALTAFLLLIGFLVLASRRGVRGTGYPSRRCRAVREPDSRARQRPRRRRRPCARRAPAGRRARQASPRALAIAGGVVLDRDRSPSSSASSSAAAAGTAYGGGDVRERPAGQPATGPGARRRGPARPRRTTLQGHPAERPQSRRPEGARHDGEFIDVQCPVCQAYETTAAADDRPEVRPDREGADAPEALGLPRPHDSFTGQTAMIAAAAQNKGFEYAYGPLRQPGAGGDRLADGREMASHRGERRRPRPAQVAGRRQLVAASKATASAVDNSQAHTPRASFTGTPTLLAARRHAAAELDTAHVPTRGYRAGAQRALARRSAVRESPQRAAFLLDLRAARPR